MSEQIQELYTKKMELLVSNINEKYVKEGVSPISSEIDMKQFISKTMVLIDYFHKQSTKVFANSKLDIYIGLKSIWGECTDEEKSKFWSLLFELFVLSTYKFPIIKTYDYSFCNILLWLKTIDTDIPLPELPALHLFSGCIRATMKQIQQEMKNNTISENLIERLKAELDLESIQTVQQLGSLKQKCIKLMERKEISHITDIIKSHFREETIDQLKTECKCVFDRDACKKVYQRSHQE